MYFDFYPLPAKMIRFDLRICSSKLGLNKNHHQFPPTVGGKKTPEISKWDPIFFSKGKVYGSQISLGISRDSIGPLESPLDDT